MKNIILTVLFISIPLLAFVQVNVDAKDIINKLNNGEEAHYENVTVSGDLDFRMINDREEDSDKFESLFDNNVTYKYHVNAPLKFTNCKFTGKVIGYYNDDDKDELHIVMFHEDVMFNGCTFQNDFLVKYTEFYKSASFKGNTFKEDALFKYSEFNSSVDFSNSIFEGEANFKYTEFEDKVEFKACEFSELATFKYTDFDEYVDYTGAKFDSDAIFKYTKFPEGVSFENVYFDDFADFKYADFQNPVNLNKVEFNGTTSFKYAHVEGKEFISYILKNKN